MLLDLTGQRVGRLVVNFEVTPKDVTHRGKTRHKRRYSCTCDCGNVSVVWQDCLTRPNQTRSCGCLHKEVVRATFKTHGMKKAPEYRTWCAMKERCSRPKNISYKNYGAKGIKVCERWRTSFENFFADIGAKPSAKHTIDRIDPNKDYEPSNCRWATHKEQFDNTDNPKFRENIGVARNFAGCSRSIES